MKVTMKEAEKLVPVSRTTLYNDKKLGTFSVEKNAKGRTVIDIAELQRVYGNLNHDSDKSEKVQLNKSEPAAASSQAHKGEVALLRKELELVEKASRREREMLEDQINHLRETLAKAQDGQNKLTLMLEHHSNNDKSSDLEKSVKALEEKISNQERVMRQNQALKKALEAEKNKSLLQR